MKSQALFRTPETTPNPSLRRRRAGTLIQGLLEVPALPLERGSTPPQAEGGGQSLERTGAGTLIQCLLEALTLPLERGSTAQRGGGQTLGRGLILWLLVLTAFASTLSAQTISVDADALRDYNAGLEHVQKKKYAAAQQRLNGHHL